MTRAASDAKRRGAAALIIIFAHPREVLTLAHEYFAISFFVPQTPARANQGKVWYAGSSRCFAGSAVLYGSGGRTAKHLKYNGSMVLFQSLTRDACAGARARAHIGGVQNHRTVELNHKTQHSCEVGGSTPVLLRFRSRTGNKQWGGNHLLGFAAGGAGRQSADRADLGVDRGAAARKFWAGARSAGVGAVAGGDRVGAGADRAISVTYAASNGRVGMAGLERSAIFVLFQCVSQGLCKPAGLAGGVGLGSSAAAIGRGGVAVDRLGGTPPSAARRSSLSLAQPIFRVSAALQIRGAIATLVAGDPSLSSGVKMGSGVRRLSIRSDAGRGGAIGLRQERVGVQGGVLGWGRSRETLTLWGGSTRVN